LPAVNRLLIHRAQAAVFIAQGSAPP